MERKINRRGLLELMGAGLASLALPGCSPQDSGRAPAGEAARGRPNILWISCEDISPDLGCYGSRELSTPNLDRLAAQGMRYTRAYTIAPVCSPNRSGIITCMYATSIGSMNLRTYSPHYNPPGINYQTVPPPYVKCFTEYLRAAGYYCTNREKTDYQFDPPLTAWDRNGEDHDDWRGRASGQPFFCVINYEGTHESMIRTPPDKEPVIDPAGVSLPPYYPDTPVVRRDWARYLDNIEGMDSYFGRVLERLERDGLAEDTVVIFWSDHGRGLPRAKRWLYDAGVHIPLIVRWPGVVGPGTVCEDLVSSIDLGPTALSVAGVEVPSYMQGRPFPGISKAQPREYVFSQRDRIDEKYDMVRSVRDKEFVYIRNFMPEKPYAQYMEYPELMPTMQEMRRLLAEGGLEGPQLLFFRQTKPVEELYLVADDPHQVRNLAGEPEYVRVLERFRAVLGDWMERTGDLGLVPEKEMMEKMWPGGVQPQTAGPVISPAGGSFDRPVRVGMSCPTGGASIAWTAEQGDDPHWLLYCGEVEPDSSAVLRARAVRIGYAESPEVEARFEIRRDRK